MTADQAKELGYQIVKGSNFEVGLVRNGIGIRTWWSQDFQRKLPELDHPKILKAIQRDQILLQLIANKQIRSTP